MVSVLINLSLKQIMGSKKKLSGIVPVKMPGGGGRNVVNHFTRNISRFALKEPA